MLKMHYIVNPQKEGREEFSKFVWILFSNLRLVPFSIRTSASAFSARIRRDSFSAASAETCSLRRNMTVIPLNAYGDPRIPS